MSSLDFIKQLAAGQSAEAKETLNNLISTVAFEALEIKKQEIAKGLFGESKKYDFEPEDEVKEPSEEQKRESDKIKATHGKATSDALKKISDDFAKKSVD